MKRFQTLACAFFAGLVTPILIVAATADARYLANQNDLGRDPSLLLPYWAATLVAAGMGAALYLVQGNRFSRTALWAFYLAGPAYIGYRVVKRGFWMASGSALQGTAEIAAVAGITAVSLGVLVWISRRRLDPRRAGPLLCVIGLLFAANEAYQLLSRVERTNHEAGVLSRIRGAETTTGVASEAPAGSLPNVYHVILDGFQTDMFDHVFEADELRQELDGFVQFRNNTTVYGRTAFALASTFYGEAFDGESSQFEYACKPFESERSFLFALKKAGYATYGFPTVDRPRDVQEKLMDVCIRLGDAMVLPRPNGSVTFAKFWVATCFPECLSWPFVSGREREALTEGTFTPGDSVVKARLAFEEFLRIERSLGGHGRYTFLHLMLPHPPFVLRSDCSAADPEGDSRSRDEAQEDQVRCANKVLFELTRTLKELGRYRRSLIIVHGDHGGYAAVREGRLVDLAGEMDVSPENLSGHVDEAARAHSRALLLLKLPDAASEFTVSSAETTLLDLAPTILEVVGAPGRSTHEGISLVHSERVPRNRERPYHFYDYVSIGGVRMFARTMARWLIRGDSIVFDGVEELGDTLGK